MSVLKLIHEDMHLGNVSWKESLECGVMSFAYMEIDHRYEMGVLSILFYIYEIDRPNASRDMKI